MKLIPVHDLIEGKSLLLIDDSIVRGTQLRETTGIPVRERRQRGACPPACRRCSSAANT